MPGNKNNSESWLAFLLALFAISVLKSLFEHDSSKIISKKGSDVLLDEEKMLEVERQMNAVDSVEKGGSNNEIII